MHRLSWLFISLLVWESSASLAATLPATGKRDGQRTQYDLEGGGGIQKRQPTPAMYPAELVADCAKALGGSSDVSCFAHMMPPAWGTPP